MFKYIPVFAFVACFSFLANASTTYFCSTTNVITGLESWSHPFELTVDFQSDEVRVVEVNLYREAPERYKLVATLIRHYPGDRIDGQYSSMVNGVEFKFDRLQKAPEFGNLIVAGENLNPMIQVYGCSTILRE